MTDPALRAPSILSRARTLLAPDNSPVSGAPLHRTDVLLGVLFFALGAIATFLASGLLDRRLLDHSTMDVWFEADIPRIVDTLSSRYSPNDRSALHPLFALLLLPVHALRVVFGLDPWVAVRATYAAVAGLWIASLFALLRLVGCRRADAGAFTLLGATSAGAMFWFPIPETHTLASPTIVFAMIVVAVSAHRVVPWLVEVVVSASTLSVTVTNWMAGILASFVRRPLRHTVLISAGAFALVVLLWTAQKRLVPSSKFFIGNSPGESHMLSPESHGVLHVAQSFFLHTIVMPEITVADRPGTGRWPVMLIQPANTGSAGVWSLISAILWGLLLGAGVWALVRQRGRERLRIFLALFLAGQFVLHVLFGNETFLYSPNFLPVLVVVAAMAALTQARRTVLVGVVALVITNTLGNTQQWKRANDVFRTFAPFEHDFAEAKRARPEGPWPQGNAGGPIKVATPGATLFETGFATAGGSFRPGLDQFMISLWVLNDSGGLIVSSDNLVPEARTSARRADSIFAKLDVSSAHYEVSWSPAGVRRWQLDLRVLPDSRVALVVRGLGPSRAPVRQLDWDGKRLLVNDRWSLEPDSSPLSAFLVNENEPGWVTARPEAPRIFVRNGWAAARLELLAPGTHRIIVRDISPLGPIDRVLATMPPSPGTAELQEGASGSPSGTATDSTAAVPSSPQR